MNARPPPSADLLDAILQHHHCAPTALLQILIAAQALDGWLPPPLLARIAQALGLPRTRVEGVARFYHFLHTRPVGRYRVLFSDDITDRMLGSRALLENLCRTLRIEPGRLSEDGLVSVDTTSCTGLCDQGPALLVNGRAVGRLSLERINQMAGLIRQQRPVEEWPAAYFHIEDNIRRKDALLGLDMAPGAALAAAIARGRAGWLDEMQASRLRGHGGAGMATALKWASARDAGGTRKVIVGNANEGEPGTFKDRVLLHRHADLVFEGMSLAAWATGAGEGFLYLRGEYRFLLPHLEAVLARRRGGGLLGRNILGQTGFDFDIRIHLGAGAYVCGEKTALIESLEGKRGTPRIRPPLPMTHGYLGRPTVVNNVETLAHATLIALHGGAAFAATGTAQSTGTTLLSVSGDCAAPGIYEYPFGVPIARVLEDCGARDTQAVQVGGAAGTCLATEEFQRRIAHEDVPGTGAFTVFDATRDLFEVARAFVHFFADESCGFCTACRVGTSLLRGLMDKLADGHGVQADLADIDWLDRLLKNASHCGLGSTASNPVLETLRKFRGAYERRLVPQDSEPPFDLNMALAEARRLAGKNASTASSQRPEGDEG